MRLGGPIFEQYGDPAEWARAVRALGYSAAYCPVDNAAADDVVASFAGAAREHDIVIAEVGAWRNPLDPDESTRTSAIKFCKAQLALAERIGARCCVNISGSRGEQWDGPHPANLTPDTFALVVDTAREIIDAVKPKRTFYTLETMPWMYPDSPESYLDLIRAIDRPAFGAHLDPVNLVCSPQRYFTNASLIRECFALLGPHIKSCHAKDISLSGKLTTHLDEARPGLGGLDYGAYLTELAKLDQDVPLMIEHLATPEEYVAAASHIRSIADGLGLRFA
jgi:sugar phosphate isomerase/epimerase